MIVRSVAGVLVFGLSSLECRAQVTLADDIIMAAQGKENAERRRDTELGRTPGTAASPYRRSPGSNDILLGIDPARRLAPLPRLTRRPADPGAIMLPGAEPFGASMAWRRPSSDSVCPWTVGKAGPERWSRHPTIGWISASTKVPLTA